VRKDDIKKSFDRVEPNDITTQRMLNKVLNYKDNKREVRTMKSINLKKMVQVFAIVLVLVGSLTTYNILNNKDRVNDSNIDRETGDAAYQVENQFQIGNKHYILLSQEQKEGFGFPNTINESDIGDQLTTITTSVDASLKGLEVYKYIPAGGEAVVVVKKNNEYVLFKFFAFESYNNNQDEDVIDYLKLYGINSAADISKIQFIGYSEQAKIENRLDVISEMTDSGSISEFFNYYSVIKNSSDQYFKKLFNYKSLNKEEQKATPEPKQLPPDYVEGAVNDLPSSSQSTKKAEYADDLLLENIEEDTIYDTGEGGVSSGSVGSAGDALNNSVKIRIYSQSGIYFDADYYPNLSFISRHEVKADFASFIKKYIGY
jgi:hypothetical protein